MEQWIGKAVYKVISECENNTVHINYSITASHSPFWLTQDKLAFSHPPKIGVLRVYLTECSRHSIFMLSCYLMHVMKWIPTSLQTNLSTTISSFVSTLFYSSRLPRYSASQFERTKTYLTSEVLAEVWVFPL